jgi:surfeit locus 1 family protein
VTTSKVRFPFGLTIAALVVFVICCGLGAWQLQRAAWKAAELKRIAAVQSAPPVPIGPVLRAASQGANVAFTRVEAVCAPGKDMALYVVRASAAFNGAPDAWASHPIAYCRLASGPYDGVDVDRGIVAASIGETQAPTTSLPPPQEVTGVLLARGAKLPIDTGRSAPYVLSAETERPAPPGVTPGQVVRGAPENLQYVGAYGPTWFGLAGVLAAIYAAMLWRRYRPQTPP